MVPGSCLAVVYATAKKRQKYCAGTGKPAAEREEFRDVIDKLIQYSYVRNHVPNAVSVDVVSIAEEIMRFRIDVFAGS